VRTLVAQGLSFLVGTALCLLKKQGHLALVRQRDQMILTKKIQLNENHGPTAKDEAHCCASELRFRVQFDRIRANQSLLPTLEPAKDPPRMPQRHSGFFPEADDRIQ